MTDFILETLSKTDLGTILCVGAMFWIFKSKLDQRFEKIDQRFEKIDQRFEKIDQRFEKMERKIDGIDQKYDKKIDNIINEIAQHRKETNAMNAKLISIETILHIQRGCKLNYDHEKKGKVE